MNPLTWYKQYCKLVDDERIRLLAFEDRWHYVAINCCKGQGILDNATDPTLLRRMIAVKLGLQLRELEALALRLAEFDLLDPDTFQPRDWDSLQNTGSGSTERVRKHRERVKQLSRGHETSETLQKRLPKRSSNALETDGQTDLSSSSLELDWSYLKGFDQHDRDLISEALGTVPLTRRQDVLDELAGASQKGAIQKAWADWLEGVCKNAAKGDFRVRHGRLIQADRRKKSAAADAERDRIKALEDAKAKQNDPEHRARADAARDAAMEELGLKKKRG